MGMQAPLEPRHREFLDKCVPIAEKVSAETGVPVMVLLSVASWESGWGGSVKALNANNYFGMHCNGSQLAKIKSGEWVLGRDYSMGDTVNGKQSPMPIYSSPLESFYAFATLAKTDRYKNCWDKLPTDYAGWFDALQKGGYNPNPEWTKHQMQMNVKLQEFLRKWNPEKAEQLIRNEVHPEENKGMSSGTSRTEAEKPILQGKEVSEEKPDPCQPDKKNKVQCPEEEDENNLLLKYMASMGSENGESLGGGDLLSTILMLVMFMGMMKGNTKQETKDEKTVAANENAADVSMFFNIRQGESVRLSYNASNQYVLTFSDTTERKNVDVTLTSSDQQKLMELMSKDCTLSQEQKMNDIGYIFSKYSPRTAYDISASQVYDAMSQSLGKSIQRGM